MRLSSLYVGQETQCTGILEVTSELKYQITCFLHKEQNISILQSDLQRSGDPHKQTIQDTPQKLGNIHTHRIGNPSSILEQTNQDLFFLMWNKS